jgi:hypothetical protein
MYWVVLFLPHYIYTQFIGAWQEIEGIQPELFAPTVNLIDCPIKWSIDQVIFAPIVLSAVLLELESIHQ